MVFLGGNALQFESRNTLANKPSFLLSLAISVSLIIVWLHLFMYLEALLLFKVCFSWFFFMLFTSKVRRCAKWLFSGSPGSSIWLHLRPIPTSLVVLSFFYSSDHFLHLGYLGSTYLELLSVCTKTSVTFHSFSVLVELDLLQFLVFSLWLFESLMYIFIVYAVIFIEFSWDSYAVNSNNPLYSTDCTIKFL